MKYGIKLIVVFLTVFSFIGCGSEGDNSSQTATPKYAELEMDCNSTQLRTAACDASELQGKVAVLEMSDSTTGQELIRSIDKISCNTDKLCIAKFDIKSTSFLNYRSEGDQKITEVHINAFVDMEMGGIRTFALKKGDLLYKMRVGQNDQVGKIIKITKGTSEVIKLKDVSPSGTIGGWAVN